MKNPTPSVPPLSIAGCRARQRRLIDRMTDRGIDAALIADARHVHYLTGYWGRPIFSPMAVLDREGRCDLIAPLACDAPIAADGVVVYRSNRRGTLEDDQATRAIEAAMPRIGRAKRIGVDGPLGRGVLDRPDSVDIGGDLLALRRRKDEDELAILTHALRAAESAYAAVRPMLVPGVCETRVWTTLQAAAAEYAGETLGEFGNDFRIAALGSTPRRRPAQAGEVAILDLGVSVRGYVGDMCRSFVIGGEPTDAQREACGAILGVLAEVQTLAKPGVDCAALHAAAIDTLDAFNGWTFKHHLGHGIGMSNHEAPRLNVEWTDTLAEGDVFTVEPGLYGDGLRAGLRIEEVYRVTASGVERITRYPTEIA